MDKKIKTFDCVEMQHQGGEKVRREIAGMTREQELDYWAKGTRELVRLKNSIENRDSIAGKP